MDNKNYKVFFNAIRTKNGAHLFAAGWVSSPKYRPVLERIGETADFRFYLKKTEDVTIQPVTPFQLAAAILDPPKSTKVFIEEKPKQVKIMGFKGVKPGDNTPGDWVEI